MRSLIVDFRGALREQMDDTYTDGRILSDTALQSKLDTIVGWAHTDQSVRNRPVSADALHTIFPLAANFGR